MHQVRLEAETRTAAGKGIARRLRVAGKVPAVLYGFGNTAVSLQLDARRLRDALQKENAEHAIILLSVDGQEETTVLKAIQRNPLRPEIYHVDFARVRMDTEVTVEAEVELDGTPEGVRHGGVVDFINRSVEIRALPSNLPEVIQVDVSALNVGDSIHVRDLTIPEGVTVLSDPDTVIVAIAAPRVEEEVAPAVETVSEPERIKREAKDEA